MPNPQTFSLPVSEVAITTLTNRSKVIQDAVSTNVALLRELKAGGTAKTFTGGTYLEHEVNYQGPGSTKFYTGYEKLNTTQQEMLTKFIYEIKQLAGSVQINGLEEAQNSGDDAFIDLLDERIAALEREMVNMVGGSLAGVYSDGTFGGGKAIGGLQYGITPVNTGILGGINLAVHPFARNTIYRAFTDGGAVKSSSNIKRYWNKAYIAASRNNDKPTFLVCDNEDYTMYKEQMQAIQFVQGSKEADAGYQTLRFEGKKVLYDGGFGGGCPASTTYMIHAPSVCFKSHAKRNMVPLGKRESIDQDAMIQHVVWYGNMTYALPQRNAIITNS